MNYMNRSAILEACMQAEEDRRLERSARDTQHLFSGRDAGGGDPGLGMARNKNSSHSTGGRFAGGRPNASSPASSTSDNSDEFLDDMDDDMDDVDEGDFRIPRARGGKVTKAKTVVQSKIGKNDARMVWVRPTIRDPNQPVTTQTAVPQGGDKLLSITKQILFGTRHRMEELPPTPPPLSPPVIPNISPHEGSISPGLPRRQFRGIVPAPSSTAPLEPIEPYEGSDDENERPLHDPRRRMAMHPPTPPRHGPSSNPSPHEDDDDRVFGGGATPVLWSGAFSPTAAVTTASPPLREKTKTPSPRRTTPTKVPDYQFDLSDQEAEMARFCDIFEEEAIKEFGCPATPRIGCELCRQLITGQSTFELQPEMVRLVDEYFDGLGHRNIYERCAIASKRYNTNVVPSFNRRLMSSRSITSEEKRENMARPITPRLVYDHMTDHATTLTAVLAWQWERKIMLVKYYERCEFYKIAKAPGQWEHVPDLKNSVLSLKVAKQFMDMLKSDLIKGAHKEGTHVLPAAVRGFSTSGTITKSWTQLPTGIKDLSSSLREDTTI